MGKARKTGLRSIVGMEFGDNLPALAGPHWLCQAVGTTPGPKVSVDLGRQQAISPGSLYHSRALITDHSRQ